MSDTPGGNIHPQDRRRGPRPRNRNRPPHSEPQAPATPREGRGPRRRRDRDRNRPRDRDRPRQEKRSGTETGARPGKKSTLKQKLLAVLTLGLVRGKAAAKAPRQKEPAVKKHGPPVPPPDPDTITSTRLHVGNLHDEISEEDLLNLFKGIGPVKSVDIVYSGQTHRSKGFGFVEFMALEDARRAVTELHGQPYMQRALILGPAKNPGQDEREADTPD